MEKISELQGILYNSRSYSWKLLFYTAQKASVVNYQALRIKFSPEDLSKIAGLLIEETVNRLLKKTLIEEYPGTDMANALELNIEDSRINYNFELFKDAIANPIEELETKIIGYCLYGKGEDDGKDIYLISKSNPYPELKNRIISTEERKALLNTGELIQLSKRIDCIIYDGYLYADTTKFESIFYLASSLNDKVIDKIRELDGTNKFTEKSLSLLEASRLRKRLCELDIKSTEVITNDNQDLKVLSDYCNFGINSANQLEMMDEYAAGYFIQLLTGTIQIIDGKAYTNLVEIEKKKNKPVNDDME